VVVPDVFQPSLIASDALWQLDLPGPTALHWTRPGCGAASEVNVDGQYTINFWVDQQNVIYFYRSGARRRPLSGSQATTHV
jgi:hypothetical protein